MKCELYLHKFVRTKKDKKEKAPCLGVSPCGAALPPWLQLHFSSSVPKAVVASYSCQSLCDQPSL